MQTPTNWKDYELLDSGDRMKLERWGQYIVARTEPQALWPKFHDAKFWERAHAIYTRNDRGKGSWIMKQNLPERWQIEYMAFKFWVRPTDFKHTGIFPEQAVNWNWIRDVTNQADMDKKLPNQLKVLNLFGYTGGSTIFCLDSGYEVTHVDASKGIVDWARENAELSGLGERPIRWIVDDVSKFVAREERRGAKYEGIIMDPPSYGRGKKNELWKIETMLMPLVQKCATIMSEDALFFILNSYTTGIQEYTALNMLKSALGSRDGRFESDTLGLKPNDNGYTLPAGCVARWFR
ncbi:MAG: class I SAM-dependent methyltransferase [Candidatus Vogelbacteria bacterium]|nr:class I SAM-dependent methyltransferase [Candidatus Vogelbacteria bacterium]